MGYLYILGCSEHDLTTFGNCPLYLWQNFSTSNSKTNAHNLKKFYVHFHPKINWCLSTLVEVCLRGGGVITPFSRIFGIITSRLLQNSTTKNFKYDITLYEKHHSFDLWEYGSLEGLSYDIFFNFCDSWTFIVKKLIFEILVEVASIVSSQIEDRPH